MDILGALTAIQQTINITKDLRNIDEKIDAAIWKLRLSDVIDKLVDTKDALIDAREREIELSKTIASLEQKLSDRGRFEDQDGLLFSLDDKLQRVGEPYCNQCYVKEDKLYRLKSGSYMAGSHRCSNCSVVFGRASGSDHDDPLVRVRRTDWDPYI
jgi:hypothetical protein